MAGENGAFEVVYYDVAERRLALTGATLSRRLEQGKGIWRLDLPRLDDERLELEQAGGPASPPTRVARLLPAFLRGSTPEPVLRLQVQRDGGSDQVEVLEGLDRTEAFAVEPGRLDETVLTLIGNFEEPAAEPIGRLRAMLERQYTQILLHDPGVRLDLDPEDVHRLRVAARRARAVLRAARPLLDPEWSEPLRAELKWLGGSLGPRRDLDVLVARLKDQIVELELPEQTAAKALVDSLEHEREAAQALAVEALSSERYLQLLNALEAGARAPSVRQSEVSLSKLAEREFRRLRKAAERLGPDSTDEELHRARILGKRARYAAELAEPEIGKAAGRVVARAKALQDVLGAHQDAIVAEARLRGLLADAPGSGAAFAAGRLVERERER
ncbi:MAG: CHAD domain-containing protein, partial [Gaiellaceae bacterium]